MKIVKLFLILFLTIIQIADCQDIKEDLRIADSLFQEKKFTESFQIYNAIYETGEVVSPRMLLKMAFIKEGLGDYSNALYYLNLYYLKTSNKKVLKKMEKLAAENGLEGYEYSDSDFFLNLYLKSYNQIVLALTAICLIVFAAILFQRYKKEKKPVLAGVLLIFFLGIVFVFVNFGKPTDEGIITNTRTYVMSGPSSGAKVLEIVKKGHKVNIIGFKDVWAQVEWNNQTAYIKQQHLKPVQL